MNAMRRESHIDVASLEVATGSKARQTTRTGSDCGQKTSNKKWRTMEQAEGAEMRAP